MTLRLPSATYPRIALFVVLSLLLHALIAGVLHWPLPTREQAPTRLTAELVPLPTPAQPPPPVERPRPRAQRHAVANPISQPLPSPIVESEVEESATTAVAGPGTPPIAEATPPAPPAAPAPPPPAPPPHASPPSSATLHYAVVAKDPRTKPPSGLWGNGVLRWQLDADHYSLDLEAAVQVLFVHVTVLASHSAGSFDAYGLSPARYTETPRNKPTQVARFDRDGTGMITYSTTDATAALVPGVQDRLSVLVEAGSLVRGNPGLKVQGAGFDVPVAGLKGDIENWHFEVVGVESVDAGIGSVKAVHIRRVLRPGTNDRGIEVWLAEDGGGYPVRIRYSEPNTSYIELSLERIE